MPVVNGQWTANVVDAVHAPVATFPGPNVSVTNAAFPGGVQPGALTAWPKNPTTNALLPCWKTTILADKATGWPAQCDGLTLMANTAVNGTAALPVTVAECSAACIADPLCSVWRFNTDTTTTPPTTQCYVGDGIHCYQASTAVTNVSVTSAQRLQHGDVRVLKNMQMYEVLNLYVLGFFDAAETSGDGALRCQNWCYSNVECTYWSYGSDGCRVDYPDGNSALNGLPSNSVAAFPLLASGVASANNYTQGLIAAEYIQHVCPPQPTTTPAAPVAALPPPCTGYDLYVFGCTPGWLLIAAILAALLAVAALLFCCLHGSSPKKQTRAVKPKKATPRDASPVQATPTPSQQPLLPQYAPQPQYRPAQQAPQYMVSPPPQYTQSFTVPTPQYNYAQVQQDPLLQSRVAVPQMPQSPPPASGLPAEAAQFNVGDRVGVWSRGTTTWHDDATVSTVDAQGWHVLYNGGKTQKVVLFQDAQNLRRV